MFEWKGAAGVCINEDNHLLMVLQAAEDEEPKWSVPSGGLEGNETFEPEDVDYLKGLMETRIGIHTN